MNRQDAKNAKMKIEARRLKVEDRRWIRYPLSSVFDPRYASISLYLGVLGVLAVILTIFACSRLLPDPQSGKSLPSLSQKEAGGLNSSVVNRKPLSITQDRSLSPTLHKTVFSNGLTLISQRRPGTRTAAIQVWARVGSRYETEELNGISHFLEHMLFKGSSRYSGEEIRRKIRSVGGYLNGETFWEYTKYYAIVPANHLETALDVLGEMIADPLIRREDVETERNVILEEISRFQDDPRLFALNIVTKTLFPEHPLGRPVVGTPKAIKKMTRSQLVDFYRAHYTADNLVLVIVGDIHPEETTQFVAQKFSALTPAFDMKSRGVQPNAPTPPPIQQTFRRVSIERLLFQAYVAVGVPTMGVGDPDRYVMDLINVILGTGKNSWIYRRIKEQEGLSDEVGSVYLPLSDIGAWGIYVGTSPNHVQRVEELIFQEFEALKNKPLSDAELELAKRTLEGNFLIEREDNHSQADFYGWYETIHEAEGAETYLEKVRQVSKEDVQRVANQYFQQNKYNLFVVKPVGGIQKILSALGYLF